MANEQAGNPDGHVEVAVVTTSGKYPTQGTNRVAAHQTVSVELAKAVKELKIVDTSGWVSRVNGQVIDPNKSYIDNHLTGTLIIDYGPPEGGGGNE